MVISGTRRFERARIEGADLEYEVHGAGEPVLFVHGALIGDAFGPLMAQRSFPADYRLLNYHRRGYVGSSHSLAPVTIEQQATDARMLLDRLGIERAHVVGHSYGGCIALQMTLDAPDRVQSLALLEPALVDVPSAADLMDQVAAVIAVYEAGDKAAAVQSFGRLVVGPAFDEAFDKTLGPGWREQAVADADTFFEVELPALASWRFTAEDAAQINQPVLSILGADSAAVDPSTGEVHELLQVWLPQTEVFELPGATHGLQMMNPAGMAEGLLRFLRRHPVTA